MLEPNEWTIMLLKTQFTSSTQAGMAYAQWTVQNSLCITHRIRTWSNDGGGHVHTNRFNS